MKLCQIVYLKLAGRKDLVEARVDKIGRKWVHLAAPGMNYRAAIGHPYLDGGDYGSPGRIWESREAYAEAVARSAAWSEFRQVLERHRDAPRGATPENLLRICGILGIHS